MKLKDVAVLVVGFFSTLIGGGALVLGPFILFIGSDNVLSITLASIYILSLAILLVIFFLKKGDKGYILSFHGGGARPIRAYLFFFVVVLYFLQAPAYWLYKDSALIILMYSSVALIFSLFYFAAFSRIDNKGFYKFWRSHFFLINHDKHERFEKGVIYIKETPGADHRYKNRFESGFAEFFWKISTYLAIACLLILWALGGGAPIVILRTLELFIPIGSDHSPHHIGMYMLSLPVFAYLGYQLPTLIKSHKLWRELKLDILQKHGQFKVLRYAEWGEEKENLA